MSSETRRRFKYPSVRRDEDVVDDFHGTEIADPYRWLEDPASEETVDFIQQQNSLTRSYLDSYRFRADIKHRLRQIADYPKRTCPEKIADRYFHFANTGLQNQNVFYVQDSLDDEPRVFLDPNHLSDDGTVAMTSLRVFSEDGSKLAYGLSSSGSDWTTLHFIDVDTGENLPDVLTRLKFTRVSWSHDDLGVFYSRYPETANGVETKGAVNHKAFYHRLGTDQEDDVMVAAFPSNPDYRLNCDVSHCGKYLIVDVMKGTAFNMVYYAEIPEEITGPLKLTKIVDQLEADYSYVTNTGKDFVFKTNRGAPRGKLVRISLDSPQEAKWEDLVEEDTRDVLQWARLVDGDKLVLCYVSHVKSLLQLHCLDTGEVLEAFSHEVGTVTEYTGTRSGPETFFTVASFLSPGVIYRRDVKTQEQSVFHEVQLTDVDKSKFETSQVFYKSKDGTSVPMYVTHKKGLLLDGTNPCLLYGYGGFNISTLPSFSVTALAFVELFNGVFAVANIRGGGEYGKRWHEAGSLERKQTSFDDFQSAAEYLVDKHYTRRMKLVIMGGSNGGLLVAACVNQRPDLFAVAVAKVGVMDMLRFHRFTIGHAWVSDYGCAEDATGFETLVKYSPLHNVRRATDGAQYPAVLLITGDHDDRVVPLHSYKLIATLQHELGGDERQTNLLMMMVETKAGHGSGKPMEKVVEEFTDVLSFIAYALDIHMCPCNLKIGGLAEISGCQPVQC